MEVILKQITSRSPKRCHKNNPIPKHMHGNLILLVWCSNGPNRYTHTSCQTTSSFSFILACEVNVLNIISFSIVDMLRAIQCGTYLIPLLVKEVHINIIWWFIAHYWRHYMNSTWTTRFHYFNSYISYCIIFLIYWLTWKL